MSVTPAIPASQIVSVTPSVLAAGGAALDLIGLLLTGSSRVPIGQVLEFSDAASVTDYFGALTQEDALGTIYFLGFNNSNVKPGKMLMAQYNRSAVAAWLRGGDVSALTLTQLKAINGALSAVIDGVTHSGTIDLSAVASFSAAAQLIGGVLDVEGSQTAAITGSISGTTLTVTALSSGTVGAGNIVDGTGVSIATYIVQQLTGSIGGTGTYQVSNSQTSLSASMTTLVPGVTYDSVSGGFVFTSETTGAASTIAYATGATAATLKLTLATGAILSQGADAAAPAAFMDAVTDITQDWASFMTTWEPGEADKISFAGWTNGQNNRYLYAMWDTNVANLAAGGPSAAVAAIVAGNYSGTAMIYDSATVDTVGGELAAFLMGAIASLDFTETAGRATMAFRAQTGLAPQVLSGAAATYLKSYGLNFYGDYTTANQAFTFLYPGSISGPFLWIDSYVNQIWLNNQFQVALMTLLTAVKSIPYNASGYALIDAACLDVINQGLNFGVIRPGIALSEAQKVEINTSAGVKIDTVVGTRGWYLQIKDASAAVRAARGSPPCKFWYTDGQSVQQINLASVEVQ